MAAGWDGRHGESMVRQDVVYGFVMIFTQALEDHEVRRTYGEEELRHDLIGAAQVNQLDLGKIQEGCEAVRASESCLDPGSHRGSCRASHQVAVWCRNRLAQQESDPNRLDHRLFASWAGMMICTCAPGKWGR
jgi:hypothetical protein